MSSAWLFQDHRQKIKLGDKKCPWSVGFIDPDGKRKSKRVGSKSNAEKFRQKIEGQLAADTYKKPINTTWAEFVDEFDRKIITLKRPATQSKMRRALREFGNVAKPARVSAIKTQTVDDFVAKMREKNIGDDETPRHLSPASINSTLRCVKAALNVAREWGYLADVPKVRMLAEVEKLKTYVTPDDFAKLYAACDKAERPNVANVDTAEWWRALLMFAYMTGWRINEILTLEWSEVDLDAGTAKTLGNKNKGKRDAVVPLHPVVVEHLRRVKSFNAEVFPWDCHERTLWAEFDRLQAAAGVSQHYGFHDLRRAFATMNAQRMTGDALQALMRHKSYKTTQGYINAATQLNASVGNLFVPSVATPAAKIGG